MPPLIGLFFVLFVQFFTVSISNRRCRSWREPFRQITYL